ncbi:MAG: SMC-Scp complex subunit ScpB [Clostridium sp.]|nr:SMC-Scp complex subunit ScpB [Clostridium sp.]
MINFNDNNEIESAIESLLFAAGDSITRNNIKRILGIDDKALEEAVESLGKRLEEKRSGVKLLVLENRLQLGTKEENSHFIKKLLTINERQSLSKGALECLSIVAFKQPVTRVQIDEIRGVNSDYVIQKLAEKEIIKEIGRLDSPGRPIIYGTTDDFLIQFGFSSLDEFKDKSGANEAFKDLIENEKKENENEEKNRDLKNGKDNNHKDN